MRRLLVALGLLVLGCAGVPRTTDSVEAHIDKHLTSRYGESFTITGVVRHRLTNGRFPDAYNYSAHPTADPTLEFAGTVDYESLSQLVNDAYACRKVERWVPDAVAAGLPERHRYESVRVLCTFRNLLPPHSEPNQPLPPKIVSMRMQVETFTDGDPLQAAEETRAALVELTRGLNVHPRGKVTVYPAEIWPYVSEWTAPQGELARSAEDWSAFALAEASIDYLDRPAVAYPRSARLEQEIRGIVEEARPDALAVHVHARVRDLHAKEPRYLVDVRVADDGLDVSGLMAIQARLPSRKGEALWELRGIDRAPDGEQRKRFVCGANRCDDTAELLIDPALFGEP